MAAWYLTGSQLEHMERRCTCCERDLSGHAVRMLELDQRIDGYHDLEGVPADKSQGWFPFGLKCAKRKIAEATAKLAAMSAA